MAILGAGRGINNRYYDTSLYLSWKWCNFRRDLADNWSPSFKLCRDAIYRVHWTCKISQIHRFCILAIRRFLVKSSWMGYLLLSARICRILHCFSQTPDPLNPYPCLLPWQRSWLGPSPAPNRKRSLVRTAFLGNCLLCGRFLPSVPPLKVLRTVLELPNWVLIDNLPGHCGSSALLPE